jgi:aryl-alcohol dehydrogenase-like predicted oxidoreductase
MRTMPLTDLEISPFVLGGNVFGWTADKAESFAVLDAYLESGGTMIDTADAYSRWLGNGGGESESLLGEWITSRRVRDQILIATKVGKNDGLEGLGAATIKEGVDQSLARLQTDHIDLYYAHSDDEATPIEETLTAFDSLVQNGKVRYLGASNYTAARLTESLEFSRTNNMASFVVLQPLYNLVARADYEQNLAPVCVAEEVGVLPYYSLAAGFLTGKYRTNPDTESARSYRMAGHQNPHDEGVLDAVLEIAGEHSVHPSAVALAWLTTRPGVVAPIASARTPEQLQDLVAMVDLELTDDDRRRLDKASEPHS